MSTSCCNGLLAARGAALAYMHASSSAQLQAVGVRADRQGQQRPAVGSRQGQQRPAVGSRHCRHLASACKPAEAGTAQPALRSRTRT